MAKVTKKATAKRRVKKNVEHGQAHIPVSYTHLAEGNVVTVKGPKGTLERALPTEMEIKVEDGHVVVSLSLIHI